MTRSCFGACRFLGLGLEVTGVDGVEAWLLHAEIFEAALHRDHFRRGLGPNIAVGMEPQLANSGPVHAGNAWNQRQAFGKSCAISFDIDDVTATEDLAAE